MFWPSKTRDAIKSNTFIKFCLIGVVNGIVGFSIILSLIYLFNINYLVSNFLGYAGGIITSFTLNKYVNFKSEGKIKAEFPIFVGSFIIAYSVNALVLYSIVELLHQEELFGLVVASAIYTILFYLSSNFLVFVKRHDSQSPQN
ncbi:MAG TPA: GtrA family protein [Methanoregula sp.]|nr:GtrA family protein [Methanoregula sp.]